MSEENIIKELSIKELLDDNKQQYNIPIYQRNYAWGEAEITQLIQDVIDRSKIDKATKYYLGTLIVDKKVSQDVYEVIDGQQRLTTLTLINAYLNKENIKASNLYFDARAHVRKYIDSLYKSYDLALKNIDVDDSVNSIQNGIKIIDRFFSNGKDLREEEVDISAFQNYFENNVTIIQVSVPKDTDINHYFEIMNTRGVQLEKHQILKFAFINQIKDDENLSNEFSKIWDSCASMDSYIHQKNLSKIDLNSFKENKTDNIYNKSLFNILKGDYNEENKLKIQENDNNNTAKFASIIDFPNFLLQVLKLFNQNNISLDDKNLLDEFGYGVSGNKLPDSIDFVNFLLETRILFDAYFLKRQIDENGDDKWKILTYSKNSENNYLVNSFKSHSHNGYSEKIIMLQSMYHVSFPNNSYKNWLFEQLSWINISVKGNIYEFEKAFYEFSLDCAKDDFRKRADKNDLWKNQGVGISNYIFNYIDLLLWLDYFDNKSGIKDLKEGLLSRINKQKSLFDKFRFTQRSSVEHIFPQSQIDNLKDSDKYLNNIGNLCLINSSSNSKYSDYNFEAKREQFNKKNTTESLKQAVVFTYDKWNSDEIKSHEEEILHLLE